MTRFLLNGFSVLKVKKSLFKPVGRGWLNMASVKKQGYLMLIPAVIIIAGIASAVLGGLAVTGLTMRTAF